MKSFTLQELAALLAANLIGDPAYVIQGVDTLDDAGFSDLSFLANSRYTEAMKKSKAGAVCVDASAPRADGKNYLICKDPSRSFQIVVELFLGKENESGFQGIHPTAVIHPSAQIDPSAVISPYAVIDKNAKVGSHTFIGPHASIGFGAIIGSNCYLHPHVVVREKCILHDRVILQPGAIIGSCGFGYIPDAEGKYQKVEQVGIVILEEDVEIGANTTIDRARFKSTIIRKGTKIDNLCQIAHNVEVGEHNIIAAQTGIAGSSKTGKYVMLGGQVGILGHVELEDGVMIATRGGVSKSLKNGKYRGSPVIPINEYHRQEVHIRKLGEYVQRIQALEKASDQK